MMGGPAALAVQTGAALMPVILWFERDGWGVHVHEEIPVPAGGDREQQAAAMMMMQEVARLFEAGIRAHPQDWHMLQRVFVADLDPRAAAACSWELVRVEAEAGRQRAVGTLLGANLATRLSVLCLSSMAAPRMRSSADRVPLPGSGRRPVLAISPHRLGFRLEGRGDGGSRRVADGATATSRWWAVSGVTHGRQPAVGRRCKAELPAWLR